MTDITQSGEGGEFPLATVLPEAAPAEPSAAPQPGEQPEQAKEETPKTFSQSEVDAMVARRLAKERRRFEREYQAMIGAQQRQAPAQQQQPASDEPTRDKFNDYEAYLEARAEWRAGQKAQEYVEKMVSQRAQASSQAEIASSAQEVIERGRAEFKDFDTVVNAAFEAGAIEAGGMLHRALIESEDGHKLAYHLATNPREAERLGAMPPQRLLIEIGRLSARLEKPVSKAPPPITPVAASGGPVERDWMAKSPAEILRERAKARGR